MLIAIFISPVLNLITIAYYPIAEFSSAIKVICQGIRVGDIICTCHITSSACQRTCILHISFQTPPTNPICGLFVILCNPCTVFHETKAIFKTKCDSVLTRSSWCPRGQYRWKDHKLEMGKDYHAELWMRKAIGSSR